VPRLVEEFGDGWKADEYGIDNITAREPLVLDVGGNIGFVSILVSKKRPRSQVVVFEPNPTTYFYLRVNLWLNGIHVITSEQLQRRPPMRGVYPVFGGLGRVAPFELVHVAQDTAEGRSQNFQTNGHIARKGWLHRFSRSNKLTNTLPVYNLRTFLDTHGLASRVFQLVKLDCECCEYNVVPDSRDWIGNKQLVKHFAGELHPCKHADERQTLDIFRNRGCTFDPQYLDTQGHLTWVAMLKDACNPTI